MIEPRYFSHPLMDNLPPIPNEEELKDIVDRVSAGDNSAKDQLIQHFLLIAKRSSGMILTVYPGGISEIEDIVSEAILIVVEIVERIRKGTLIYSEKLLNYVAVLVIQGVNEMLFESRVIPVPRTTQRRNWRQGKEPLINFSMEEMDTIPSSTGDTDFEGREALNAVICSPVERQIVKLREEGYNDAEIADVLGLWQQTVNLLRINLYQRYVEATQ